MCNPIVPANHEIQNKSLIKFLLFCKKIGVLTKLDDVLSSFFRNVLIVLKPSKISNLGNQHNPPMPDPLSEMNIWAYFAVNWLIRFGRTRGVFENSLPSTIVFPNRLSSTLVFTLVCSDVDGSWIGARPVKGGSSRMAGITGSTTVWVQLVLRGLRRSGTT